MSDALLAAYEPKRAVPLQRRSSSGGVSVLPVLLPLPPGTTPDQAELSPSASEASVFDGADLEAVWLLLLRFIGSTRRMRTRARTRTEGAPATSLSLR